MADFCGELLASTSLELDTPKKLLWDNASRFFKQT
jgi:hypothetical protein